jgi:hypothetical protein
MLRRELLKISPFAIPGAVGQLAAGVSPSVDSKEGNSAAFNVRSHGATGDGKTVDSTAINRAIEVAAAAGGGVVVFPAGTYVCFTIRLKSNVELYLSPGCTILAADSPRPGEMTGYRGGTYDPAGPPQPWEAYQDYGHNHWPNSLFYGEGISNFSICGPGLIHGKGLSHGSKVTEDRGGYVAFQAEQAGVGNKTISLKNCHNVLLRAFSVLKGGHFAVLATGVDNLTLDHLTVDTDRDGFDIDCCRNVRVSNCTVNSPWDDAICPKSSYALGYVRSTDNVTISNNYVTGTYELGSVLAGSWKKFAPEIHSSRNGRIKCGTESNGGFRNITITGNVIEGSKGIALETSDGAFCEDIAITENTMRDIVDAPLFLRLNRRNRGPADTMRPGTLRRILISGLVSHHAFASTSSMFSGIAENPIEDVKIADCYFDHQGIPTEALTGWGNTSQPMPAWAGLQVPELASGYPELLQFGPTPSHGFFLRHLRNLEMAHVEIAPQAYDPRPAFHLEDVHRADLFAVTAPPQPNFSLKDVTDLRILWSRAARDITLDKAKEQVL